MKNRIENFKNFSLKKNENVGFGLGFGLVGAGLLLIYGLMYGYVKLQNLFNFVSFTRASSKLSPIFDKIKDDDTIKKLVKELGDYKDDLYFEEDYYNPRKVKAFEIRDSIYQRAKELLDEREYNIFIDATEEFERGSEKPASYFTDKDAKFQGWKYTV